MRITVTGNGRVVAEIIRGKAGRAFPAWREASRKIGDEWLTEVRKLSSVQYTSTAQLRRLGHPYAVRHFRRHGRRARGMLPAPAWWINRQTGRLLAGWRGEVKEIGRNIYIRITNLAAYFIYLHFGTRKMIRRPILGVSLRIVRRRLGDHYQAAQRRVHGLGG